MSTLSTSEHTRTVESLAQRKSRLPMWVFIIGFFVSTVFWYAVSRQVKAGEHQRFGRVLDQIRSALQARVQQYQQVSTALAGLFTADVSVDRKTWSRYASALDPQAYPGALGFEFIRYVRGHSVDAFLNRTRAESAPEFGITPEGTRPEMFVIEYIEPLAVNSRALGLDIGMDPTRREAAIASIERNQATVSKRVTLVQDEQSVSSCLLLQPVYTGDLPLDTVEQRWAALLGWVCIPIRIQNLLEGVTRQSSGPVHLQVFEGEPSSEKSPLFESGATPRTAADERTVYAGKIHLDVLGQPWTLDVRAGTGLERFESRFLPMWVLVIGLVSTLCASWVVRMLGHSRQRAVMLARDMTFELRREIAVRAHASQSLQELSRFQQAMLESAGHAIIATDRRGLIRTFNPAAQRLLGYLEQEVVGHLAIAHFHDPRELARRASEFGAELGETVAPGFDVLVVKSLRGRANEHEWTFVAKTGARLQVMLTVSALTDESGVVTGFLAMAIDITERTLAQRRLALFVEHAPAAVAMFDRELRYLAVSHRWLRQYNLQNRNVIGQCHYDVFPGVPDRWREIHQRCLAGAVETCDDDTWRPEGWDRDQHLRWEVRPWNAADGQVGGLMMYVQDITSEREHEHELVRLHEAAEAASRAKSNFLAAMSHEIRTPMNGVLGFANLLLETELTEEQRGFVQTITTSGQSLLTLINDILDYSKIEAGRIELENHSFDLEQVLVETIELLSTSAEAKNLPLALHFAPDAPRTLVGDSGRVRQVILNLLGNAIKFTADGHVLVSVERSDSKEGVSDWHGVRLSVSDTGIGIPASKIGMLFNKFTQADASTARKFGGTGLGLAISRQLVELMGGEIGVLSEEGKGSTFWFSLPAPLDAKPSALLPPKEAFEGIRVLVVDDSEINRRVLHHQLLQWGIDHDVAPGGPAALLSMRQAWACGRPFHVALVDHFMPEMSGEELGRKISSDPDLNQTSLILLTSAAQRRDAAWIVEAGFQASFLKPIVRIHALLETLLKAVERFRTRQIVPPVRSVPALEVAPDAPLSRRAHFKPAAAPAQRVLLVEDNPVNQKLATLMLKRLGCAIEVAPNGRVAVDKVESGGYDLVFMDCHMPVMDGFEATRLIRQMDVGRSAEGRPPIIVALTASVLPEDQRQCLEAGMDDFITKPVKSTDLQSVLQKWLVTPKRVEEGAAGAGVWTGETGDVPHPV